MYIEIEDPSEADKSNTKFVYIYPFVDTEQECLGHSNQIEVADGVIWLHYTNENLDPVKAQQYLDAILKAIEIQKSQLEHPDEWEATWWKNRNPDEWTMLTVKFEYD